MIPANAEALMHNSDTTPYLSNILPAACSIASRLPTVQHLQHLLSCPRIRLPTSRTCLTSENLLSITTANAEADQSANHDTLSLKMGLSGHADPAAVLGVTISFTIIATFAVLLRLYSRVFIVHSPGKDDAFIAAACAMTICLTTAQCFQGSSG